MDLILDEAAQKGTGKWTLQNAFDMGAPVPTINTAVESRILSSLKAERVSAARARSAATGSAWRALGWAVLYASKIALYAQGFAMLRLASAEYGWDLNLAAIAKVWRAGGIIRAGLLEYVAAAFARQPQLHAGPGVQRGAVGATSRLA